MTDLLRNESARLAELRVAVAVAEVYDRGKRRHASG